jgi:hypothetical protein
VGFLDHLPEGGSSAEETPRRSIFSTKATAAINEQQYTEKLATNKKSFAQGLVRLAKAGDMRTAIKLLQENRGVFSDEELKNLGLGDLEKLPEWQKDIGSGENGFARAFRAGDTITGGGLSWTLDKLDQPAQYVKLAIGETAQGNFGAAASGLAAGANMYNWVDTDDLESRVRNSGLDQDGDGRLTNLRETLGKDMNSGGRFLGAFDFAGSVVLDPTTYVSFGAGSVGKAALKTVAREFGKDAAKQIAQKGLSRALKEGIEHQGGRLLREDIERVFRVEAESLVQNEAAKRAVRKMVEREGADAAREKILRARMATLGPTGSARSGLRVGVPFGDGSTFRTVIPSRPGGKAVVPGLQAKYAWQGGKVAEPLLEAAETVEDVVPPAGVLRQTELDTLAAAPSTGVPTGEKAVAAATRHVEDVLPKAPGSQKVLSPDVVAFGVRGDDGELLGFARIQGLMEGTPNVELIHTLPGGRGKGVAQQILRDIEDAGLDLDELIRNSEFTDEGRALFERYLSGGPTPAPAAARGPRPVTRQPELEDTLTVDQVLRGADAPAAPAAAEAAAPAVRSQFQPGSVLSAGNADFEVLGVTEAGELVARVTDDAALIPFKRTPPLKGNARFRPDASDAAPDTPNPGKVTRRGQGTFNTLQPGDVIPDVGVVRAVDDDGTFILRRPDIFEDAAAAAPRPPMTAPDGRRLFDLPQRTAKDVLPLEEFGGTGAARAASDEFRTVGRRQGMQDVLPADDFTGAATRRAVEDIDIPVTERPRLRGGTSSAPVRRSFAGAFRDSKPGRTLREAFVPRTGVRDKFGGTVADNLYENVVQSSAEVGRNVNDMLLQLGTVSQKAAKNLSGGAGENLLRLLPDVEGLKGYELFNDLALREMDGAVDPAALRAALAADGADDAVKALDAFDDVAKRGQATDLAARGGVQGQTIFGPETPTAPRILTKEGAEALRGNLTLSQLLGVNVDGLRAGEDMSRALSRAVPEADKLAPAGAGRVKSAEGAIPGRTYAEIPVKEVNEELTRRLGLDPSIKLFEDDALAQVVLRSRSSFQAGAQTTLYENLAKESLDGENPMLVIVRGTDSPVEKARKEAMANDLGWVKVESNTGKAPVIGDVYGPKEIVDEVAKVQDLIVNDTSMRRLSDFLTKWNGVWATQATVPVVFGTGFHTRNAIGNVINAFNGGLTNPARFVEAVKVQHAYGRVRALMKKEGIPFEEAMARQIKSPRTRRLINDMRQHSVMSEGFFADLSGDEVDNLLRHNSWKDWLNPKKVPERLGDNALTRTGRHIGQVVEDNARVALYMDAFAKTGSVQQAANTVKKYLFDYSDLTPFEKRVMRSTNRFYTFARKNLAVQLYTMAMDPWRIKQTVALKNNLTNAERTENAALPEYARKSGFGVAGWLGVPTGTEGVAMNIETPLDAALETLEIPAQALSLIPGVREMIPESRRASGQDVARSVFNWRAGGTQSAANFIIEQASGKDMFSGADISDESGMDTWKRFARTIAPLYGKYERTWENKTPGMDLRLSLLQALAGLQVLPVTDKQKNQLAYVGAQEVQNAIADLREQGIDVPTYSEFVALGLAPDFGSASTGERRSPEEAAQARVDKLNAARESLGASPFRPETATAPARGGGGSKSKGGFLAHL